MSISTSNVEQSLLEYLIPTETVSYILTNIDKSKHIAVFSRYNDAVKYMIRTSVNLCHEDFMEHDYCMTSNSYKNFITDYMNDNFEIVTTNHLDLQIPVYARQIEMKKYSLSYVSNNNTNSVQYLLKINPSLPELEEWRNDE